MFTPPRHGKSETISRLFTAYFLHRYPDRWVGLSSYSADLANTLSRNARDNYKLAGNTIRADAAGVQHWETGQGGGLWATGAGGPVTGKGGHCFPAGTRVLTEYGSISIDGLYRLQDRPKVLSFNHEKQALEWQSVTAAIAQPGRPLVEVVLHSGRRIRCTADHPIYCVERGYREAASLVSGEAVIQVSPVQELSDLWDADWQERDMYGLSSQGKGNSLSHSLCALWGRIHALTLRTGEVAGAKLRGFVLRHRMQSSAPRSQESQAVQGVQSARREKDPAILRGLPPFSLRSLALYVGYSVRLLREALSTPWLSHVLLWQGLRPVCAFDSNERQGQQPLQDGNELCRLVQKDASGDSRKRWALLRSLWREECTASDPATSKEWQLSKKIALDDSPHRQSTTEQQGGKPCGSLLALPRQTPQINRRWQTDTVSSVTALCDTAERVYDIQVAGNSNFFAEGILVHNCLIVDDPIKNAEEAASETIRAKLQDWWNSTWYTREEPWSDTDPNGAMIVVQCMTGDTPVLMADGTEIPLRDVKAGDQIATYDNGKLVTSKVLNHRSNHNDFVYRITMTSGKIVRANERHPFLVEEDGQLKWVRLKNLTTDHKIVTLRGNGGSGKGRLVTLMVAKNPPFVEVSAIRTTKGRSGQMGIVRRQSTRSPIATSISSIGTGSLPPTMMRCLWHRMESALFASNPQEITSALIGVENYASITATSPIQSEDSCVTIATSPWGTPRQKKLHSQWLNTSDFTIEQIESIEPAGIEEVFDIQVERTENFIANGLVSHNTRWHEDDLAGWLLEQERQAEDDDDLERWHIVNLPAIAEEPEPNQFPASCTVEPDWREPGMALCPERRPIEKLRKIEKRIGGYFFDALFQQRPTAKEGEFFKVSKLETVDATPAGLELCRGWDLASTEGGGAYTSGVLIGTDPKGVWYVLDVARGQWSSDDVETQLISTARSDGPDVLIHIPQDPGQAGKKQAISIVRMLAGYAVKTEPASGSKETRAFAFSAQVNVGNVKLLKGAWNKVFIEELRQFPRGKYKDQVDSSSDAFNELALIDEWKIV